MIMPIADINRIKIQEQSFAAMPLVNMTMLADSNILDNCFEPSKILDQHFALQNGSHKDVKQYVIYFRHIMAFFADGSHCGLDKPKQFVAYLGYNETPESIVLKEDGVHIELVLNTRSIANKDGAAKRIEFPAQTTFTSTTGDDYVVE